MTPVVKAVRRSPWFRARELRGELNSPENRTIVRGNSNSTGCTVNNANNAYRSRRPELPSGEICSVADP